MGERLDRARGSVTLKILLIGFLALLLLIPAKMIEGLIGERGARAAAARAEVGNFWGNAQTAGGPMLALPFRYTETVGGEPTRIGDVLLVLPERLTIDGRLEIETRRRSIYEVPVYTAKLDIAGDLRPPDLADLTDTFPDIEFLWNDATIVLPLSDPRALSEPVRIRLADAEAELEAASGPRCVGSAPTPGALPAVAGTPPFRSAASPLNALAAAAPARVCISGSRLTARYAALGLEPLDAAQRFSMQLTIRGTGRLHFLPLGDVTDVNLVSSWRSPSFNGSFAPIQRTVTDNGFTAAWRVLAFGRGYPSSGLRSEGYEQMFAVSSFGVDLLPPLGVHQASLRAVKYAILFVGLTFLVYFLCEVFAGLRLHALQYLSVGVANSLFFLLLLALAEHIGFELAYVASALGSILLITAYSAAALGTGRRALYVAGLLSLVYAYLYIAVRAEDYALLIGALGLFAAVAAFMMLTRRVDWFALSFEAQRDGSPYDRTS